VHIASKTRRVVAVVEDDLESPRLSKTFIRPGVWKKVLSKVRRPWRMSSSLTPIA
jgi:hypothetical protein